MRIQPQMFGPDIPIKCLFICRHVVHDRKQGPHHIVEAVFWHCSLYGCSGEIHIEVHGHAVLTENMAEPFRTDSAESAQLRKIGDIRTFAGIQILYVPEPPIE